MTALPHSFLHHRRCRRGNRTGFEIYHAGSADYGNRNCNFLTYIEDYAG